MKRTVTSVTVRSYRRNMWSLEFRADKILQINIVLQNVTNIRKVAFTEKQVRRLARDSRATTLGGK